MSVEYSLSTVIIYILSVIFLKHYRTRGDGNCLYRACSKLLCGKENLSDMLRNLTSIELFNHQEFYASHPCVLEKLHVFKSENTAFSATLSDSGLGDGYDRKNPSNRVVCIQREAIRNATVGTYSSLMCLFALTSVTGMSIISVYPEKLGQKTKYSQFQNGVILPRQVHNNFSTKLMQEVKLIIMWTSSGIDVLPGLSKDFQPNHFVPLVEFKAKTGSKQPKITTIFKANSSKKEKLSEGKYCVHVQLSPVNSGSTGI